MTQAVIIAAVPFAGVLAPQVEAVLDEFRNPAVRSIAAPLNDAGFVHFMSMSVIREAGEDIAHLMLEASVDGSARTGLARIARTIGDALLRVLKAAGEQVPPQSLAAFLERHRLNVTPGWFSTPGVSFMGTPGLSVARIRKEAHFAAWVSDWLENHPAEEPPLAKLEGLRSEVFRRIDLKWAFVAEPMREREWTALRIALIALRVLWPLLAVPLAIALLSAYLFGNFSWTLLGVFLLLSVFAIVVVYAMQRWLERKDCTDEPPPADHVAQLMDRENRTMQNHVLGVSTLRTGGRLLLRFVFGLVAARARGEQRPGFLMDIGTIHFATWLLLPRTRTLLFFSNYDGSWLSYLEDFIAQAHEGLTAIWSNARGFPKTANDGERFKRWSRRQQRPTRFWYSAYPDLTTARIRKNAAIRHGFACATNDAAAAEWLTHAGFPPRPDVIGEVAAPSRARQRSRVADTIERGQIPTLVFGELAPWRFSRCFIVTLRDDPDYCRQWLQGIERKASYGRRSQQECPELLALGFTCDGLRKIGLDQPALAMFPSAFVHGMAAPWRSRVLGDTGSNCPEKWWWGADQRCDAVLVLYAQSRDVLAQQVWWHRRWLREHGHKIRHRIALTDGPLEGLPREPFGFIDGISQPVIRGTRDVEDMHTIAAGEMVLGYEDNRGYKAPSPEFNHVDVGRNGTFLVVRQLEQDPDAFQAYLRDEAARLIAARNEGDPRVPHRELPLLREWIAAKMVGRWREDGSSVVSHPDRPGGTASDNNFRFGEQDPHGLSCPFGSHVRRANPRDSLAPGSQAQLDITNQHRILRVGRPYHPPKPRSSKPGLLFMCVNADIEGQFEFLQQTWLLGRSFHGLEDEVDHLVGPSSPGRPVMTVPTQHGPLHLRRLQDFITVRGGGYFFMPSKATLGLLAQLPSIRSDTAA